MRKIILTALLASAVAMPAMAQEQAKGRWQRSQDGQSASSDDDGGRPARAERAGRPERPERAARTEQVERVRAARPERVMSAPTDVARGQGGWSQQVRARRSDNDGAAPVETRRDPRSGQSFAERLAEHRRARGETVHRDRTTTPAPTPTTSRYAGSVRQWTTNHWRSDRRYDWRGYRDHNHSIFRFGNYYDPYRSSYRRFSIGFNLWPSYYQSNYWLNDPWMYRLPPVYGPYRWVRYYDDALLVNIYTGEVEDVVRDFFW